MAPLPKHITPSQRASLSEKAVRLGLHPAKIEALASIYSPSVILTLLRLSTKPKTRKLEGRNQDLTFPIAVTYPINDEIRKAIFACNQIRPPKKIKSFSKSDWALYQIKISPYYRKMFNRKERTVKVTSKAENNLLETIKKLRDTYVKELTDAGFRIRDWNEDSVDRITGEVVSRARYAVEILK